MYRLLKFPVFLARLVWCPRLLVEKKEWLESGGPLLIAANHPNSFLDALLIAGLSKKPVYSLARGDVFAHPFAARMLKALNIFPVYRLREGSEHLHHNYTTFDLCLEIFRKNGTVLIFSEGLSINEWKLRPLAKGTARLALRAWEEGIPLEVLPAGINYSNFGRVGKTVHIFFGEKIGPSFVLGGKNFGEQVRGFNNKLQQTLKPLVYELSHDELEKREQLFGFRKATITKVLGWLPASAGWLLHLPFYLPVRFFVKRKLSGSDHFDSVLIGTLFFLYPIYLAIATWILMTFTGTTYCFGLPLLMPVLARSYVVMKNKVR